MNPPPLVGGIEAGGTKFVCAIGTGPDDVRAEIRFPTTTPDETFAQAIDFFQAQRTEHTRPIAGLGIASFGPVDLNPRSPAYGTITTTPKQGWANADIVGAMQHALDVPIGFDTDVDAAALGEARWGAGQGLDNILYLTIGTGIGGGAIVNGRVLHGLTHPEMGHIRIPHDLTDDPFPGVCPYHGDCLEGLAAGPAIQARWGARAETLPDDHPAWALEARYLAFALANWIVTLSPERIVLGGGVMQRSELFPPIRQNVESILNGYVTAPQVRANTPDYIVPPGLGGRAGVLGALALAYDTLVS
jgi:fructokinase